MMWTNQARSHDRILVWMSDDGISLLNDKMDLERYDFKQTVCTRKIVVANAGTLFISEFKECCENHIQTGDKI